MAAEPPEPAAPDLEIAPEMRPAHVSEGVEFVESFAEPGAEEGAGAAVHVEEPWKGYRHMAANEIIARLTDASPEALAAVELYERVHRGRQTVVAVAERQLRLATAAASATATALASVVFPTLPLPVKKRDGVLHDSHSMSGTPVVTLTSLNAPKGPRGSRRCG